eukprot:668264-Pelagomonas_calceolata.AAC.1
MILPTNVSFTKLPPECEAVAQQTQLQMEWGRSVVWLGQGGSGAVSRALWLVAGHKATTVYIHRHINIDIQLIGPISTPDRALAGCSNLSACRGRYSIAASILIGRMLERHAFFGILSCRHSWVPKWNAF